MLETLEGAKERLVAGGVRVPGGPKPLVSVLVVVFREREELDRLIDNLAPFRGRELEVIVMDGGSADGTRDLLERRTDEIDVWLSEPDEGVYDAMNKVIACARGEFLLHINAGDRLLQIPWERLRGASADVAAIACRVEEIGLGTFVPRNDSLLRHQNTWHHQGTFYRRSLHLGYDPRFRVFGDFDHNQRMRIAGLRVELSSDVVATHEAGGLSHLDEWWFEHLLCIRKNFGLLEQWAAQARFWLRRVSRRSVHTVRHGVKVGPAAVCRSAKRQAAERIAARHLPATDFGVDKAA